MKGAAFLLKLANGEHPMGYRTVAGLRETSSKIGGGAIEIEASGIFLGSAAETKVRALALSGETVGAQLSYEDGTKLTGTFVFARLEYQGNWNSERNYSLSLSGTTLAKGDV